MAADAESEVVAEAEATVTVGMVVGLDVDVGAEVLTRAKVYADVNVKGGDKAGVCVGVG